MRLPYLTLPESIPPANGGPPSDLDLPGPSPAMPHLSEAKLNFLFCCTAEGTRWVVELGSQALAKDLAKGSYGFLGVHFDEFPGDTRLPCEDMSVLLARSILGHYIRVNGRIEEPAALWTSAGRVEHIGYQQGALRNLKVCAADYRIYSA